MRDFLVLCQSTPPNSALESAARLALAFDGTVSGLRVCETLPVVFDTMLPTANTFVIAWAAEQLEAARAAAGTFQQWAAARGVARAHWLVGQGALVAAVTHAAQWHDVVVIGREEGDRFGLGAAVGGVFAAARRPVLVLPARTLSGPPDTIAIAWNGSSEATAAVHDTLPWLRRAQRVVVFEGEPRRPFDPDVEPPRFDLAQYLAEHEVRFELARVEGDDSTVGAMILARCAEIRADLLVMGAYGRARALELVLGGVTHHVLRHATLPVLMRH
jgi:nucleotide-binding universal stress UspA family protein